MSLFSTLRGVAGNLFQIGKGGPQLKNNGGNIDARNSTDSALVNMRGAAPTGANDFVTLGTPGLQQRGYFGDGSDGAAAFDGSSTPAGSTLSGGNYTLSRDVYYASATVSAGVTVTTNGWRFFCAGTLTNNGALDNSGKNGGNGGSGVGGTAGAGAVNNTVGGTTVSTGGAGGFGAAGGNAVGDITNNAWGGAGENGFAGTSTAGGFAALDTRPGNTNANPPRNVPDLINGSTLNPQAGINDVFRVVQGGSAGGGGGASASFGGGGGGGGGGVLIVVARIIAGAGVFTANGGGRGNQGGTGAGSGGGGGGGFVGLVYSDISGWTGAATASGGGSAANGTVVQLQG